MLVSGGVACIGRSARPADRASWAAREVSKIVCFRLGRCQLRCGRQRSGLKGPRSILVEESDLNACDRIVEQQRLGIDLLILLLGLFSSWDHGCPWSGVPISKWRKLWTYGGAM